jgi:hypothetical protein
MSMTSANEIEDAVRALPEAEFAAFSSWFEQYEEQRWDEQIKRDQQSGPLRDLISKARQDFASGRCRPL